MWHLVSFLGLIGGFVFFLILIGIIFKKEEGVHKYKTLNKEIKEIVSSGLQTSFNVLFVLIIIVVLLLGSSFFLFDTGKFLLGLL